MNPKEMLRVHLLITTVFVASGCSVVHTPALKPPSSWSRLSQSGDDAGEAKTRADLAVASARLAEDSGNKNGAMKLYSEAIAMDPSNSDAHWRQAILFADLQQIEDANASFEKAIELNQSNSRLYADYGYHLYIQDRFAEAEEALRTAIRMQNNDPRAYINLGLVLAATGREQEAITSFLSGGCSEAAAQSNLAFVQAMNDDFTRAHENYQKSLALDPSLENSSIALKQLNKLALTKPGVDQPNISQADETMQR